MGKIRMTKSEIRNNFQTPISNWVIGLLVIISSLINWSFVIGPAVAQTPYYAQYWILGTVNNAADGTLANGRTAIIHDASNQGIARAYVSGNRVIINVLANQYVSPGTYSLSVPRTAETDYGAGPQEFTISGKGWDEVTTALIISQGGGPGPGVIIPPTGEVQVTIEPTPTLTVWFGNRLYQEIKDYKFYIPKKPNLKIRAEIVSPFEVDERAESFGIVRDAGTPNSKDYSSDFAKSAKITAQALQADAAYTLSDELSEGEHTFTFTAKSKGTKGTVSTGTLQARVTILAGPLRIVDTPITFPSPYSPTRDKEVIIQYTLSDNANIDIYIYSIAGELIKRIFCASGQEGGSGTLNKVKWNGVMDIGGVIGNGIYSGTIVARDENRILGKFKLTVFH